MALLSLKNDPTGEILRLVLTEAYKASEESWEWHSETYQQDVEQKPCKVWVYDSYRQDQTLCDSFEAGLELVLNEAIFYDEINVESVGSAHLPVFQISWMHKNKYPTEMVIYPAHPVAKGFA